MARRGRKPRTAATTPRVAVAAKTDGWEVPGHLSDAAKAAWLHVVALLAAAGNLGRTDPLLVETYAINAALLRSAARAIEEEGITVSRGIGKRGPNPGIAVINSTSMRLKAIINDLGLCPATSKYAASSPTDANPQDQGKWDDLLGATG